LARSAYWTRGCATWTSSTIGSWKPFHDLRHTYASLLIAEGLNVVFVSRQMGHSSPDITLRVYSHLWGAAEHASKASAALDSVYGASS
jgi:integrase